MLNFILYLVRWQLSSPILYFCMKKLPIKNNLAKTIIANLIGGTIFFFVDKYFIFK